MNVKNITKQNSISMFFVEFIRISDVIKWVLISFTGFILGITSTAITTYLIPFFVFFVSTFCIMSFTFVINNCYDIETDRENPRRMYTNAIASGKITKKAGVGFSVLCALIALVISLVFKIEALVICILLLLQMYIYSAPPLRIKGRPGMDILWHFGTFMTIVLWGSLLAGSVTTINWLFAISVALDSCIGQVWNHYRDYLFDKKSRTKTFAVLVGTDITKKTLNILLGVHLIVLIPLIFFYSLSYFATIIILISGIVIGFFILQPQKHPFPSKQSIEAYIAIILSGSVYASCIIYHILSVIGFSPLGLFHGIGIL